MKLHVIQDWARKRDFIQRKKKPMSLSHMKQFFPVKAAEVLPDISEMSKIVGLGWMVFVYRCK